MASPSTRWRAQQQRPRLDPDQCCVDPDRFPAHFLGSHCVDRAYLDSYLDSYLDLHLYHASYLCSNLDRDAYLDHDSYHDFYHDSNVYRDSHLYYDSYHDLYVYHDSYLYHYCSSYLDRDRDFPDPDAGFRRGCSTAAAPPEHIEHTCRTRPCQKVTAQSRRARGRTALFCPAEKAAARRSPARHVGGTAARAP